MQHPAGGNRKKRKEFVKENDDGHSPSSSFTKGIESTMYV